MSRPSAPAVPTSTDVATDHRWPLRGRPGVWLVALAVLAFAIRFVLVLQLPGGLGGNVSDDSAAYYAGADALVHGRLPYRDFVLLHPPLLDLLLTPFAGFGALVGDHVGFMTAIVFAEALGAVNAVLVALVARRYGLGAFASLLGGLFYAVWLGSVTAERVVSLETVGNTALLLGLLALAGPASRRSALLGGIAIGAAATAKLTWVLPPVVILAWWLIDRRTRPTARRLIGGLVIGPLLICGVFFLAAPRAMFRMIVVDQFVRPPLGTPLEHLRALTFLDVARPGSSTGFAAPALATMAVVTALVAAFAWRHRPARLAVVLAVAQVVALVFAPSYFPHYAAYAAPALSLTVAAAVGTRPWRTVSTGPVAAVLMVAIAVAMTADILTDPRTTAPPFPRAAVATAIRNTHCPTPDGPIVLIETDTLSSTLAAGCPNWIDVTGRVYDVDRPRPGAGFSRRHNARWQRSLTRYLLSGDVVILQRRALGVGAVLGRRLAGLPLLLHRDGVTIYRVRTGR